MGHVQYFIFFHKFVQFLSFNHECENALSVHTFWNDSMILLNIYNNFGPNIAVVDCSIVSSIFWSNKSLKTIISIMNLHYVI